MSDAEWLPGREIFASIDVAYIDDKDRESDVLITGDVNGT